MSGDLGEIYLRVDGLWVSGNAAHRTFNGRRVLTAEAKAYTSKVATFAIAAKKRYEWQCPEFCAVRLLFWNGKQDWDNSAKVFMDALQGILYENDSRILDARVCRLKNKEGAPYVEVYVRAIEPGDYGFGKVSARLRDNNVAAAIAALGL